MSWNASHSADINFTILASTKYPNAIFFLLLVIKKLRYPRASSLCQSLFFISCFLCFLMLLCLLFALTLFFLFCLFFCSSHAFPLLLYLCRCLFAQGFVFNCIFLLFFLGLNLSTHEPLLPPAVARRYCAERCEEL